jgi:hypothetical protein
MTFWEKIQKDVKRSIEEGIAALREGGTTVSKKIELLTEEGKRRYKIHTLHMKVKDEFERLGGQLYDLVTKKAKDPLSNRKITSIISRIRRLENQITRLERKAPKRKG